MLIPLCLMSIVTITIVNMQFKQAEQTPALNEVTFQSVANPIARANLFTMDCYNEVKLCATKTPDRFESDEYNSSINSHLAANSSALVVRKNGNFIYVGNANLFGRVTDKIAEYGEHSTDVDDGSYIGGNVQVLIKQKDFKFSDGGEGSVFILTDVMKINNQTKGSFFQIVVSIIIIMFLTSALVAFWLYRSLVRPINALRESTNNMTNGNLDVSVENKCKDEIGDLCGDFEEMRLHMKDLLADSLRHEQDYKDLMRNISHDLKTPLTAIKGYAEGILDGVASTPEKQEKYIRTIYSKANEMTLLVDELSMYAKIDTNAVPYNFINLNLANYFDDIITETRLDLELQNMEVDYVNEVDPDQEVIADSEQLTRCVNNIIANAVKYRDTSRKGKIDISISDIEGGYVRIKIHDNGKGISVKDLPYIFDRFYRADSSRNSATGGSGLGLAIVKKIIDDHGGRIWAESKQGVGTTMNILLRKVPEKILEVEKEDIQEDKKSKKRRASHEQNIDN